MQLATWQEVKKWLNLDFDDEKDAVETMADGIEGYLSFGTGLMLDGLKDNSVIAYSLARSYLQQKLYAQYYSTANEAMELNCRGIIELLKLYALAVQSA